jgi:hypothetical protein
MSILRSARTRTFVALALLLTVFAAGRLSAKQPMMADALSHLRAAEKSLLAADADKGGHRRAALDFTRKAIDQVEKGMRFDRRH